MYRSFAVFLLFFSGYFLSAQSAIEFNSLGERKLAENDVYTALEYFSRSVELNARYHESLYGMARAYFRLAEYEAAEFYIGLAEELVVDNLDYANLKARIQVGLGELENAAELFSQVLKREPYNLSARLGMAEIDLIENRFTEAEEKYLDSLTISPESKRALLSLLLLYDSTGNFAKGDQVMSTLDEYYPFDPDVSLVAAQHYHRKGDLSAAEEKALTLLSVDSSSEDVRPLLARIYLEMGQAEKSVVFLEEQLKFDRKNLQLRYLLAVSYSELGRITESLHNFDYILKNAPYDEISRLAAENLAVRYSVESSVKDYSSYHFDKGRDYEKLFRYDKALAEYRRGLKIHPESVEGRLLYAGIYQKRGFGGKYLDILNLLSWNGYDDPDFLNRKKQFEHLREKTLADQWEVDQFYLLKNRYLLDIFVKKPDIQTSHSLSEQTLADYYSYELEKFGWLEQNGAPKVIAGDSEAYRQSHGSGSDYYIVVDFFESERLFSLDVSLHLSRTGVEMDSYSVLRAGNGKVAESVRLSVDQIGTMLPVRGNVMDLDGGKALINLGMLDGIELEDRFIIARKDKTRFVSESPWYEIADEDKLGLLTVTALDEAVAECDVENPGFFELINTGDEIFLLPDDAEIELSSDFGYNETLKRELLRIH